MPPAQKRSRKPTAQVPKALPHELERQVLLKRVYANSDWRVVVLLAPSGFGKSTLLAQIARRSKRVLVWLLLTEDDATASHLAAVVLHELQRLMPAQSFSLLERALQRDVSAEGLGRALADDLNALDQTVDLILDRCEVLGDAAGRFLETLVERLGEGHRVLVAGFASSPLPLARWSARADVLVLTADDLRFSESETKQFFKDRLQTSHDAVNALDGFPAALALAAQQQGGVSPQNLILERLQRLSDDLRQALPSLAVLEVWSDAKARELDLQLPQRWLEQVVMAGLPVAAFSALQYRPHALLLEVLADLLKSQFELYSSLSAKAATLALNRCEPLLAFKHFCNAQQWMDASRLLLEQVPMLFGRLDFALAKQLIRCLPELELLDDLKPMLATAMIETGEGQAGEMLLRQLLHQNIAPGWTRAMLSQLEARYSRFEEATRLVEEGVQFTNDDETTFQLMSAYWFPLMYLKRIPEAEKAAHEMISIGQRVDQQGYKAKGFSALASIYGETGRSAESSAASSHALQIYDDLGLESRKYQVYNNWADSALLWGDSENAIQLNGAGLQLTNSKSSFWSAHLTLQRGIIFLALNQLDKAIAFCAAALENARSMQMGGFIASHTPFLAQSLALADKVSEAENVLKNLQISHSGQNLLKNDGFVFAKGVIEFCKGEYDLAKKFFEQAKELSLHEWDDIRAKMYIAAVLYRQGLAFEAQVAKAFCRTDGTINHDLPLISDFAVLKPFYIHQLLPNPKFTARVQALLDLEVSVSKERDLRPVLRVNVLNNFDVSIDDTTFDVSLTKARELLAYLVLNGSSMQKDILNNLWGGSSQGANADYFRVTVRKLRLALSNQPDINFDPLPFQDGKYQLSHFLRVESDVRDLEDLLNSPSATLEELRLAYTGAFLPFAESDWAVQTRAQLLNTLVSRVMAMAVIAESQNPAVALNAYRFALELEPLAEEAYEGLQRLAVARGDSLELEFIQLRRTREIARNLN